jgi:leader peptidase (prepilin peptidase)/N-methyltransferase
MAMESVVYDWIGAVFLFAFGACIGSFLNVVAYRIPLGKSIISPASSCPHCGTFIRAHALIPIIGYFLTGRRCGTCKMPISFRYPVVELLTALLTVFLFFHHITPSEAMLRVFGIGDDVGAAIGPFRYDVWISVLTGLWILYTGIALTLIDLDHQILPDVITLPGTVVGFILGSLNRELEWTGSLAGILVGACSLLAIAKAYEWLRKREGMGLGDVKYLGFIGAVLGWQGVVWVVAIASMIGAVVGISLAIWRRKSLTLALPFGPFLAFGALVVFLWGLELREWFYPPMPM